MDKHVLIMSLPVFLLNAEYLAEKQNKYHFSSLWFDPIGARTQDLPHDTICHVDR